MRQELTTQEILDISITVAEQSTYIERKMAKDVLVYQALSGEEIEDKIITVELYEKYIDKINEVYETCTNDGLIDAQVNSILENRKMEIYEEVKETISKALENVNVAIDSYTKNAESKGVDLQGLLAQMKEVG
jgi:heterodisulfide reductase subunit B